MEVGRTHVNFSDELYKAAIIAYIQGYDTYDLPGKKLIFADIEYYHKYKSHRDGNPEIYIMDIDGRHQKRLTNTPNWVEDDPSFSPDGKKDYLSWETSKFYKKKKQLFIAEIKD